MKALLVCATEKEIKPLLKTGFREKGNADLLITDPGMPSTVYYLTKLLCKKKYDLVINAGICGSFNKNYPLGDVVNVVEDCFSDLGAEDDNRFIHISEMNL
ncbi:MAG: futalosine hydrolase, partial [Bacteroidia bacterium]